MEHLQLLFGMLEKGGPIAVAAFCLYAYLAEKKERQDTQKSMNELIATQFVNQATASNEIKMTLESLKDLLNQIFNKIYRNGNGKK